MSSNNETEYSLLRHYHQRGFDYLKEALKLDENFTATGKKATALNYYRKGIEELEKGVAVSLSRTNDAQYRERAFTLREKMVKNLDMAKDRVRDLEAMLTKPVPGRSSRPSTAPRPQRTKRSVSPPRRIPLSSPLGPKQTQFRQVTKAKTAEDITNHVKRIKGIDTELAHKILDQVLERHPGVTFEDIAGLEDAKRALKESVILPALNPELFTGLRSPVQGLLLFGPPGNGKTMLAKAAAAESNCVFFSVSASDITSKWTGEAEKLVKALFVLARDLQPAVVFIDEIDSILCQRSSNEHEVTRRMKTEFLLQFDGMASSASDRVLVMGATNRPFDLDEAVLRRFPKRIYVPLPSVECRQELLQKLLAKNIPCSLKPQDIRSIASRTDGYSSSDLTVLAKEAAMGPLREIPPEKLPDIRGSQLRPVSLRDFLDALGKVKPSTKREQLQDLEKFNQSYGS